MVDKLINKFNDLIKKIPKPMNKKGKESSVDFNEATDPELKIEKTIVDPIISKKLEKAGKKNVLDEKQLARKRIVVRIAAVGLIIYLILDEYFPDQDVSQKNKKIVQVATPPKKQEPPPVDNNPTEPIENTQIEQKPVENQEPVIPVENQQEEVSEVVEVVPDIEESTEIKKTEEINLEDTKTVVQPPEDSLNADPEVATESNEPISLVEETAEIQKKPDENQSEQTNQLTGEVKANDQLVDLPASEKGVLTIIKDINTNQPKIINPVEQPDYNVVGRGLVYNCRGAHWACIDKENFSRCRSLKDWADKNSELPYCVPFDVYKSVNDCATVQVYNVNMIKEIGFCQLKQ